MSILPYPAFCRRLCYRIEFFKTKRYFLGPKFGLKVKIKKMKGSSLSSSFPAWLLFQCYGYENLLVTWQLYTEVIMLTGRAGSLWEALDFIRSELIINGYYCIHYRGTNPNFPYESNTEIAWKVSSARRFFAVPQLFCSSFLLLLHWSSSWSKERGNNFVHNDLKELIETALGIETRHREDTCPFAFSDWSQWYKNYIYWIKFGTWRTEQR